MFIVFAHKSCVKTVLSTKRYQKISYTSQKIKGKIYEKYLYFDD